MNMEILTIEHLAPYLPYNISLQFIIREDVVRTGVMTRLLNYSHETHPERVAIDNYDSEHIWMFKPILKPMYDLIGEIGLPSAIEDYLRGKGVKRIVDLPYWAITYLLGENQSGHNFDVFGLIEKGLAIDINTLDI